MELQVKIGLKSLLLSYKNTIFEIDVQSCSCALKSPSEGGLSNLTFHLRAYNERTGSVTCFAVHFGKRGLMRVRITRFVENFARIFGTRLLLSD